MQTYGTPSEKQVANHALAALEAARAKDVATHERNLPAIENNKAVAAEVERLMDSIGVPRKFVEKVPPRTSRSRSTTVTREAGWITDLRREAVTDDGFASYTATYQSLLNTYQAYAKQAEQKDEQEHRQREIAARQEVEKRKADMELAAILLRYELPIESSWSDVLEALRTRDQRLNLAVAMENVRGDWNDGCGEVVSAIHAFTIRTDEDKDIINDVLGCTRDFEDGRVFRDTTWSYDVLYASVADQVLAADCRLARSRAQGY
jgi:hypothetical protein